MHPFFRLQEVRLDFRASDRADNDVTFAAVSGLNANALISVDFGAFYIRNTYASCGGC